MGCLPQFCSCKVLDPVVVIGRDGVHLRLAILLVVVTMCLERMLMMRKVIAAVGVTMLVAVLTTIGTTLHVSMPVIAVTRLNVRAGTAVVIRSQNVGLGLVVLDLEVGNDGDVLGVVRAAAAGAVADILELHVAAGANAGHAEDTGSKAGDERL